MYTLLLMRYRALNYQIYTTAFSVARNETAYVAWGHSTIVSLWLV